MIKELPQTSELLELARDCVWFQPPEKTLRNPVHFLAYAMTYSQSHTVRVLCQYLSQYELRYALDHAPAGVFDRKSWVFWHTLLRYATIPPLPSRAFAPIPKNLVEFEAIVEKRRQMAAEIDPVFNKLLKEHGQFPSSVDAIRQFRDNAGT